MTTSYHTYQDELRKRKLPSDGSIPYKQGLGYDMIMEIFQQRKREFVRRRRKNRRRCRIKRSRNRYGVEFLIRRKPVFVEERIARNDCINRKSRERRRKKRREKLNKSYKKSLKELKEKESKVEEISPIEEVVSSMKKEFVIQKRDVSNLLLDNKSIIKREKKLKKKKKRRVSKL